MAHCRDLREPVLSGLQRHLYVQGLRGNSGQETPGPSAFRPLMLCGPGPQVDGKKYHSLEDGIQVLVIDGSRGHVLGHTGFRSSILQGVPWQVFSYVAAIPDK